MELLDTDSCRGTVPMEPPMSNSSMRHRKLLKWFDDTRMILQGASYIIAAGASRATTHTAAAAMVQEASYRIVRVSSISF